MRKSITSQHEIPTYISLHLFLLLNIQPAEAQVKEYQLYETYGIEKNGTIHLKSQDATVKIQGAERKDVKVEVEHRVKFNREPKKYDFKMKVDKRSGDLHISEEEKMKKGLFSSVSYDQLEYKISIEAPRSVSLEIRGDDDTYTLENINGAIQLNGNDIKAILRNLKGQRFDFSMDDGRIQMDQGKGRLNLDMEDGRFTLDDGTFDRLNLEADDGTFKLTNTLALEGKYVFQMDDGQLDYTVSEGGGRFIIQHDDATIHAHGGFKLIETNKDRSEYRLEGGKATIDIETDDGRINLQKK